RFEPVRGLCEVPANQTLLLALVATASGPNVHGASTARREAPSVRPGNRVAARLCGPADRRPPSVHGPFERERVEERDGVLVAVDCEVAVVEVDHRDARAHEP